MVEGKNHPAIQFWYKGKQSIYLRGRKHMTCSKQLVQLCEPGQVLVCRSQLNTCWRNWTLLFLEQPNTADTLPGYLGSFNYSNWCTDGLSGGFGDGGGNRCFQHNSTEFNLEAERSVTIHMGITQDWVFATSEITRMTHRSSIRRVHTMCGTEQAPGLGKPQMLRSFIDALTAEGITTL